MSGITMARRDFLKVSGAAGAGLALGVYLPGCGREGAGPAEPVELNAWVHIDTDGVIRLIVDRSEMGPGVSTALPMLLAEELEVPLDAVRFEFAPSDEAYFNPMFGSQGTGGSTSVERPGNRCGARAPRRGRCWWPRRPRVGASRSASAAPGRVGWPTR